MIFPSLLTFFQHLPDRVERYALAFLPLGTFIMVMGGEAKAQQTPPITPSGFNTQVSAPVTLPGGTVQHNITGGTRPSDGANLFHSFGEFGVPTNHIANFLNDAALPTSNILSRVTGGNPSNILGKIQTEGFGNANLFLMNPAGIVFGPNASLNVAGSTHFTTADYLRLSDGVQFTALPSAQDALLSIAPIAAFGFLGSDAPVLGANSSAGIAVNGLEAKGSPVNLVGRDGIPDGSIETAEGIGIRGPFTSPQGQISLTSVASPGEVTLTATGSVTLFAGNPKPPPAYLGGITITLGGVIDVSGDKGGTVIIRGGKLMLDNGAIFANTQGRVNGDPTGIDIQVTEEVSATNGSFLTTDALGGGNGGSFRLMSDNFVIRNSLLGSRTFGSGTSGGMHLEVSEAMTLRNSVITSQTNDAGNAGHIHISTENVLVDDAIIGTGSFGEGQSGNLTMNVDTLTVQNGGFLDSRSANLGDGGLLTIQGFQGSGSKASDVTLTGAMGSFTGEPSAFIVNALGAGTHAGKGGEIAVFSENLTVENGARIVSRTEGDGNAGNIDLHVGSLEVKNGGQIFSGTGTLVNGEPTGTGGPGKGGELHIEATQSVVIGGRDNQGGLSGLFSNAQFGTGDAGNLSIKSPIVEISEGGAIVTNSFPSSTGTAGDVILEVARLQLTNGGEINASTLGPGDGGAISIRGMNGPDSQSNEVSIFGVDMNSRPSAIIANALGETIHAGNAKGITIRSNLLQVERGARVTSRTKGNGNAGNIDLQLNRLEITDGGQIFTGTGNLVNGSFTGTGGPGKGGDLTIKASEAINISGQDQNGLKSGLFSNAQFGSGDAGDLNISTPILNVNGGLILASSQVTSTGKGGNIIIDSETTSLMNAGTISVESSGGGASGSITIHDSANFVSKGGILSAKVATGEQPGGQIAISAGQNILLTNGAQVIAKSDGSGNAGDITLIANENILVNKAIVTTEAAQASGGNIKLTANDTIQLVDTTLASSVQGDATTAGGDVTLDPDFIILKNSQVLARAVKGQGGNISLIANKAVLVDSQSTLDASSQTGISGSVTIESPIQVLSSTIAPLPSTPVNVAMLYATRCVAGEGGHFSTFVDSKTDSVAPAPGTFLASPLLFTDVYQKQIRTSQAHDSSEVAETVQTTMSELAAFSPSILFFQLSHKPAPCR